MARKREFRTDRDNGSVFGRLILTRQQRQRMKKWGLYGLLCLLALILQDVLLYRVDILGAGTDLVPCMILLIALMQDVQSGSLFSMVAGLLYYCSGSAPGAFVIPVITVLAVLLSILRQGYLQQGFAAVLLSTGVGMLAYEMFVFLVGLILGSTNFGRVGVLALTAAVSLILVPVCYPAVRAIDRIGGDLWNE